MKYLLGTYSLLVWVGCVEVVLAGIAAAVESHVVEWLVVASTQFVVDFAVAAVVAETVAAAAAAAGSVVLAEVYSDWSFADLYRQARETQASQASCPLMYS